jgi:hypothetical protein
MPKTTHLLALLALLAFTLATLAHSQQPAPGTGKSGQGQQGHPGRTEQQGTNDQRGTDSTPLMVKVIPTPKTQAESAQEAEDRQQKSANDRKLVDFTGYLVVATAILAAIGFLQLCVFGLQARRLRQTVEAMEDTAERQLRAYAQVTDLRFVPPQATSAQPLSVGYRISNTGQTPAYQVAPAFGLNPYQPDFKPGTALPIKPDGGGGEKSRSTLGPGQHQGGSCSRLITDAELAAIRRGEQRLYLYGTVWYEDAFKTQRHTNFCCLVALDNDTWTSRLTEQGNDAT